VRYYCPTSCGGQPFPSIASLNISSHLPLIIGLEENGTETKPANISFNSASILEENSTTETIVYTLSFQGDDAGYYSFIFPGSCQLQPVLYIGNDVRSLDLGLIKNWLEMGNGLSQRCPALELDVTLFGLTNTFYDRLPVTYSVS